MSTPIAEGGTRIFVAPSQTQAALRLKEVAGQIADLLEIERSDGSRIPYLSTDELGMLAEGLKAQTFPRQTSGTAASTTSGTTRLVLAYLRKGTVLTSAWLGVGTNGSGLTLVKAGIWRTDGVLQAATVDGSATVSSGVSNSGRQLALTSQWTVPADGAYYFGVLQVGTTPALLFCCTAMNAGSWPLTGAPHSHASLAGQTDVISFTPPPVGGNGTAPWIGFT